MALVSDHNDSPNPGGPKDLPPGEVWRMLKDIDVAMLVTRIGSELRARPMATIPQPEQGLICILVPGDSTVLGDIAGDGRVLLCYQGNGTDDYVAVDGRARINSDKHLVQDLWSAAAEAYWPDGPEENDVVTVVIEPGRADVWNADGVLVGIAKIAKSVLTGTTPDMGERGKTEL